MNKSKKHSKSLEKPNEYYINKKLFWIPIVTTSILLIVIFLTQGISAFSKSAEVDCPPYYQDRYCEISIGEKVYQVERGETVILNDQKSLLVYLANYSVWVQLILIFTYNHLKYNKNKITKNKLKKFYKDLTE